MSNEEIEAAFTQFFGTIQPSHSHEIEWFVPIDFYKYNSAEKVRERFSVSRKQEVLIGFLKLDSQKFANRPAGKKIVSH